MEAQRLSHFRLLGKIGEGGMGVVYEAEDERLGRHVALKLLPPGLTGDAARRRRFLLEARAAAAVRHPAIATIYEVGEEGDTVFIAMELVEGRTLRALLAAGIPPLAESLRIATEIARGLERAHAAGIVHRDLKPDNVMVEADGGVKILDFGLAKVDEAPAEPAASAEAPLSQLETRDAELTQRGSLVGTAAYMSPEQARGQAVDQRSDLFSLGVLLYELLTGRHPFRAPTTIDTLSAILKDHPPPAGDLNSEVPPALERALERLLAKDPQERTSSATALIAELEAVMQVPLQGGRRDAAVPRPSIAVLPFADMSPQKDQDYFCEGIADELINALVHVEGLRVAARTSAFQFKGRAGDVRRIGQQLGVDTVLEGSVRLAGKRLRITAQLVDTANGYHLWSERYDRDMEDVFAIQDEIAATIVGTLEIRLVAEGAIPRVRRSTADPEAYQLYLQGRYWWNQRYAGSLKKGLDFFEQAIARDPSYALAYAGIADSYSILGFYGFLPPKTAFGKAKGAAERALALDDGLAEAHTSVALVRTWFDWDWTAGERALRRSLELNPKHQATHIFLGQLLALSGRGVEGEEMAMRGLDLDPLSPLFNAVAATIFYHCRHYEQALELSRRSLELEPNYLIGFFGTAIVSAQLGLYDKAVAAARKAVVVSEGAAFAVGELGYVYGLAGNEEQARELLRQLEERSRHEYVWPFSMALILGGLGEREGTLDWLQRAYEDRNSLLCFLGTMPEFDPLRAEPRFVDLLRRLNLPLAVP